jgi:hypothetical protein
MNKRFLLILLLMAAVYNDVLAQVVRFDRATKATVSVNGTDTLRYPFTGGWSNPQFSNIDLDGDNVQDLFVFERIGNKVFCFLRKNNQWVHAPQFEVQFPQLYSWALLRDYNCDGKLDIFTETDYNSQPDPGEFISSNGLRVLRNISTEPGVLKWKQDKNQIKDMGVADLPPFNLNLSIADINAIEDIDNDGDLDLLVMPNGKNVITFYQNMSKELNYGCDSLLFKFRDECWGYASYLVNTNGFLLNDNSPCYREYKHGRKHNGTTLSLLDYDNDGDKDLLYGDVGFNDIILLTNGRTVNSLGRDSIIKQDTIFPTTGRRAAIQLFPATFVVDINGDGRRDLIVTPNSPEGAKNRDMVLSYHNTSPSAFNFSFQQSDFLVGQMLDLGGTSSPQLVDLDKDGDLDMVIATKGDFLFTNNSLDRLVYFENTGSSSKASFVLRDTNFLNINGGSDIIYNIAPCFGDVNNDGKADLLLGDQNGNLHYYLNTSVGSTLSFNKVSSNYFNIYAGTFASPQFIDLNKDGKLDIVLGRRNGTLAYYENKGSADSAAFTADPSIDSIGGINISEVALSPGQPPFYFPGYSAPHVCDLDKDGNYEILVGAQSGRVHLFRNFDASATRKCEEITKIYRDFSNAANGDYVFGARSVPFTGDLDGDGTNELLIGNTRGGIQMYQPIISGVISSLPVYSSQQTEMLLYPNPNNGRFMLKFNQYVKDASYAVYSLTGAELYSGYLNGYEQQIDTPLEKGLYIIQIQLEKSQVISKKIVVE